MEAVKAKTLLYYDPFIVWLLQSSKEARIVVQAYNRTKEIITFKIENGTLKIVVPKDIFEMLKQHLEGIGFTDNIATGGQWILRGEYLRFIGGIIQWNTYVEIRPGDDDGNIE